MDEFMLDAYYREQDRRLHDAPYYGDDESNIAYEIRKQALEALEADDGLDLDILGEDPLETYKWYKEMGM